MQVWKNHVKIHLNATYPDFDFLLKNGCQNVFAHTTNDQEANQSCWDPVYAKSLRSCAAVSA